MLSTLGYVLYIIAIVLLIFFFGSSFISCFAHTLYRAAFLKTPILYKCLIPFVTLLIVFVWSLLKCPIPSFLLEKDNENKEYCPKIYEKFYIYVLYIFIGFAILGMFLCVIKRQGYLTWIPILHTCNPFDPNKMDIGWNILLFVIMLGLAYKIGIVFTEVTKQLKYAD